MWGRERDCAEWSGVVRDGVRWRCLLGLAMRRVVRGVDERWLLSFGKYEASFADVCLHWCGEDG